MRWTSLCGTCKDGLFWFDEEMGNTTVDLGNHTDALDAWWYGERGHTKPARRPRQRIDNATAQLLDDIESTGAPSRLEAQLAMLEMADQGRKRVAAGLRRLRRKTERDGAPHDMTLVFERDFAITVFAVPYDQRLLLGRKLATYGSYRVNASVYGVGSGSAWSPIAHTGSTRWRSWSTVTG
jgi:hypothetical protein